MPDQTPPPPLPPQPPPPPLQYQTPGAPTPQAPGAAAGSAQRVFDTVAGPNLRLRDNLIQLACVIVGGVLGAVVGRLVARDDDSNVPLLIGALVGLVAALVISGAVIAIVRGKGVLRKP